MIFFQTFYCKHRTLSKVLCSQITSRCTISSSGYIYIEAHIGWISSRCSSCSEMRFSTMYGSISIILQDLRKRSYGCRMVYNSIHIFRLYTIIIPLWEFYHITCLIRFLIQFKCPVCHPVSGSIHSRHETASSR